MSLERELFEAWYAVEKEREGSLFDLFPNDSHASAFLFPEKGGWEHQKVKECIRKHLLEYPNHAGLVQEKHIRDQVEQKLYDTFGTSDIGGNIKIRKDGSFIYNPRIIYGRRDFEEFASRLFDNQLIKDIALLSGNDLIAKTERERDAMAKSGLFKQHCVQTFHCFEIMRLPMRNYPIVDFVEGKHLVAANELGEALICCNLSLTFLKDGSMVFLPSDIDYGRLLRIAEKAERILQQDVKPYLDSLSQGHPYRHTLAPIAAPNDGNDNNRGGL